MDDLKKRFGRLVAIHRHRADLTQSELAEQSGLSVDMVAKVETGATAPSFRTIEGLAKALRVDPAEFFTAELSGSHIRRPMLVDMTHRLAGLSDGELAWVRGVVEAALKPKK